MKLKNLFIWSSDFKSADRDKYIPNYITGEITLSETKSFTKNQDYEWLDTEDEDLPPLPAHIYAKLKRIKEVRFDFCPYWEDCWIVSEKFLNFITTHNSNLEFDKTPITLLGRGQKQLTDKPYFFIRFSVPYKEDCQESIILDSPFTIKDAFTGESTYYRQISTTHSADILIFDLPEYIGFAVNEELVPKIKETFELPFIYSPQQAIDSVLLEQSLSETAK